MYIASLGIELGCISGEKTRLRLSNVLRDDYFRLEFELLSELYTAFSLNVR